MAAKPLTTQSIALTEKKMDMSLDDIIKMSKTNTNKGSKQRLSNRSQKISNNISQEKNAKVQRFTDTRSSMRQGALSQRRTNFQGNQFRLTTEAARKAAVTPIRGKTFNQRRAVDVNQPRVQQFPAQRRAANPGGPNMKQQAKQVVPKQRPQTLDSLFANMKEQRMRSLSQQNIAPRRNGSDEEQMMRSFPQHNNGHRRNGASEEQRFRSYPQQYNGPRRNGGGGQQIVPWARGHFAR